LDVIVVRWWRRRLPWIYTDPRNKTPFSCRQLSGRFSRFFHCKTQHKICYKTVLIYPTVLKDIATLPRETVMFQNW